MRYMIFVILKIVSHQEVVVGGEACCRYVKYFVDQRASMSSRCEVCEVGTSFKVILRFEMMRFENDSTLH